MTIFRTGLRNWAMCGTVMLAVASTGCGANAQVTPANAGKTAQWEQSGWGGGGYYWAAAFHPKKDGVIYLAGDVLGVYKTVDHGRNWRITNNGLTDYGVYSLAVDNSNPETVYAASEGGLYKSVDGGENWKKLPQTGKKELRITGERGVSVRAIAVDPTNGNIVYSASPSGKIYKSTDGGENWKAVYTPQGNDSTPDSVRVQYGKVNANFFGGLWLPLTVPAGLQTADTVGFGFAFKGDGNAPRESYLNIRTTSGANYRSKNLSDLFKNKEWQDVLLKNEDFIVDPEYAKKNPDAPKTIDWATVNRMDLSSVGSLPTESVAVRLGRIFFGVTKTPDGKTAPADKPILLTAREFSANKSIQTYGNIRIGEQQAGSILSVAVSPKNPATVLAVSQDNGLMLSNDAGATWNVLQTPVKPSAAAFDPPIRKSFMPDSPKPASVNRPMAARLGRQPKASTRICRSAN